MGADVLDEFDFDLLNDPNFKEDEVREEIVAPILNSLGYRAGSINGIIRSTRLEHPFVKIGSKRVPINLFPDYLLTADGRPAWILDAKHPSETITYGENVEQAYSYAIHPDVRVNLYGLCNGKLLTIFSVSDTAPKLTIDLRQLSKDWDVLYDLLNPTSRQQVPVRTVLPARSKRRHDYVNAVPPNEILDFLKQSAKRHFGAHPYFTKQVWNVVRTYVETFTQKGDVVLDPFGGSAASE